MSMLVNQTPVGRFVYSKASPGVEVVKSQVSGAARRRSSE